jgi:OmpA-OmpF porin, OOP family
MTHRRLHVLVASFTAVLTGFAFPLAAQQTATFTNFDFVPGERILFVEDLMRDRVGNFPQRLQLVVGNMEVVEVGGKRFIRSTSDPASFRIVLPEALPARFTIEFDVYAPHLGVTVAVDNKAMEEVNWADACSSSGWEDLPASVICFSGASSSISGGGVKSSVKELQRDTTFRARIQGDGRYIKAYVNEDRVVNFPTTTFGRGNSLLINVPATPDTPILIGNFLIAAGGKTMYDALSTDGRVVTQGIYFDVGSDRIRPESAPTLALITDMMKEHADLKLAVEGHTDNSGVAAANQALSEKRAQAIVQQLAGAGVPSARLSAKGMGASKPAASNDTAEGRQQNRRVELVKM